MRLTYLGGKSVVIDVMLGAVSIVHSVVNIYFFELIVIRERATGYIDSYLRLPVCFEHQELPGVVQVSGNLKAKLIETC